MSKSATPRTPKVQRWIDLIAALLRYHYPVEFATIAEEVPAYRRANSPATIKRMFERDKDELRALGIPIESIANAEGVYDRYRLKARDFYLPYLTLVDERQARRVPARPRGYGYQALTALDLSAEEFEVIVKAGQRVQDLGDPVLARDGAAALRKLAHDVTHSAESTERVMAAPHSADALELLDDAIRRRKVVAFMYHGFGRNDATQRDVRPYSLVFLSGVWYLVAQDADASSDAPVKQFRVQRMRELRIVNGKPQQPDFVVPAHVDLRQYATVRHPWELGTESAVEAIVAFHAPRGATHDAIAMGRPIGEELDGAPIHRGYTVRRIEAFARFLLAQGGDAVPLSPESVVDTYRALLDRTQAVYPTVNEKGE